MYPFFLVLVYGIIFSGVSEFFFWDEFSSRFNFITVDYLVYTSEVIGNIRESYPINSIMLTILVASILIMFLLRQYLLRHTQGATTRFSNRLRHALQMLLVPALAYAFVTVSYSHITENRYLNELASNGVYNFFAAFRNNELDYQSYYITEDENKIWPHLHQLLQEDNSASISDGPEDFTRHIKADAPEKN